MYEYLHDDLIIHTHVFYTLQRGKRVYTDELSESTKNLESYFEFEAYLFPPLLLLPATWKRFGYTLDDVNTTYGKIDAGYVWAISLLLLISVYEPESSSAGVRSTFQSPFAFLFISRKTVFDIFVNSQIHFISKEKKSVLCYERPDHKPLLPKVAVSSEWFHYCKFFLPPRHPSFCWAPHYSKLIPFKDILMVPVEYDNTNNLIQMVRVVKKTVYDEMEVHPKCCVVTMPVIAHVGEDKVEYIILEESCFFYIDDPKSHVKNKRNAFKKNLSFAKKIKVK